ncbi:hypothetical protein HAX54_013704 [Datura stramonium]|uniref:Uncharacterized protein n=1 Tax=Datura stramonium TaxID=4076 RepID=A0ABS8RYJ7_DATST|nr:hypothetical protein [Datura stramonium]
MVMEMWWLGGRWKQSLPEMETGEGRERGVATLSVVAHENGEGRWRLAREDEGKKKKGEEYGGRRREGEREIGGG